MMHCKHLITDDDYEAITAAPNDSMMNAVILQYVRAMDLPTLLNFADLLKAMETQEFIGSCLEFCMYICITMRTLDFLSCTLSYSYIYTYVYNYSSVYVRYVYTSLFENLFIQS